MPSILPLHLRRSLPARHRASGLFLCHAPCRHVFDHFARLKQQSGGLVDWVMVIDEGHLDDPRGDEAFPHPSFIMPHRFARARALGRVMAGAGLLDTVIMPRVLAAPHDFVWAVEYDVDYSGHWASLFRRFVGNRADVLTTTVRSQAEEPDWVHWPTCRAPEAVPRSVWRASFNPIMRLSRRFADAYVAATRSTAWGGHYEFTVPTIARHLGLRTEDIAQSDSLLGRLRPPLYTTHRNAGPAGAGTFVYRPVRDTYFQQRPEAFPDRNRLYHPVKPGWTGEE
jgi:hypothetical protein